MEKTRQILLDTGSLAKKVNYTYGSTTKMLNSWGLKVKAVSINFKTEAVLNIRKSSNFVTNEVTGKYTVLCAFQKVIRPKSQINFNYYSWKQAIGTRSYISVIYHFTGFYDGSGR